MAVHVHGGAWVVIFFMEQGSNQPHHRGLIDGRISGRGLMAITFDAIHDFQHVLGERNDWNISRKGPPDLAMNWRKRAGKKSFINGSSKSLNLCDTVTRLFT